MVAPHQVYAGEELAAVQLVGEVEDAGYGVAVVCCRQVEARRLDGVADLVFLLLFSFSVTDNGWERSQQGSGFGTASFKLRLRFRFRFIKILFLYNVSLLVS